jgi:hypothetical protein
VRRQFGLDRLNLIRHSSMGLVVILFRHEVHGARGRSNRADGPCHSMSYPAQIDRGESLRRFGSSATPG